MNRLRTLSLAALACLLACQASAAAAKRPVAAARKPVSAPAAVPPPAAADHASAPALSRAVSDDTRALLSEVYKGSDKKRFKAYLKKRLARVKEQQKARAEFFAKETKLWERFSDELADERQLFERRMVKQMEGLFESLGSLDRSERSSSLNDIGIVQSNMVKTFESQQKQKLADFFSQREQRWKDFAVFQERDRAEFAAKGVDDWRATAEKKTETKTGG